MTHTVICVDAQMSAISVEMWGQGNPPMGAEQVLFIAGGPALSYTVRKPCADQHDLKPAE